MKNGPSVFVKALALWLLASTGFVTFCTWPNRRVRATVGMGWGLILLWIFLGGTLMRRFREPIRRVLSRIRLDWRVKFILFATVLALAEEAVTTTMTNLAPLFGVRPGEAYITASSNYLDVVAFHGVVVIVPIHPPCPAAAARQIAQPPSSENPLPPNRRLRPAGRVIFDSRP
jgi:hypothetical protein